MCFQDTMALPSNQGKTLGLCPGKTGALIPACAIKSSTFVLKLRKLRNFLLILAVPFTREIHSSDCAGLKFHRNPSWALDELVDTEEIFTAKFWHDILLSANAAAKPRRVFLMLKINQRTAESSESCLKVFLEHFPELLLPCICC